MLRVRLNLIALSSAGRLIYALLVCLIAGSFSITSSAQAQSRTLKLYYLHTGEKTKITYYKNGKYIPSALKKVNWALRDWRRNQPTKMDPKLLDLVYEAYRRSGSKAWIHVISGYRSPKTNNALRRTRGGQAKNSQHTHGKALDFYLPDVKIRKLREIGLKMGIGGVGYYPKSGSPFVHLDTGSVRHWPRMSRKQLVRMFPKGNTMHVPTDGKPLARYKTAVAAYKKKKSSGKIVTAEEKKTPNIFQRLAAKARGDENEGEQNTVAVPRAVKTTVAKPKPAPKLPEPVTQETLVAVLPRNNVPVPISAPRGNTLSTGAEITVAALPPEKPIIEPVPVAEPITVAEPIEETLAVAETTNNFVVPVPVKRPQYEEVIVTAALAPEESKVEPIVQSSSQNTISGLSPTEIQDLRKSAGTSAAELNIARPAASVGTQELAPNGLPLAVTFPADQPIKAEAPKEAPMVVATLEPVKPVPTTPLPQVTIAPQVIPVPTPQIVTQVKPIEAPVVTTEPMPAIVPEPAPRTEPELAIALAEENKPEVQDVGALDAIESVTAGNEPEIIPTVEDSQNAPASIVPIPTPSPVQPVNTNEIVVAKLELEAQPEIIQPEPIATETEEPIVTVIEEPSVDLPSIIEPEIKPETQVTALQPALRKRTVSLDQFSAPQDNTSSIGQYALKADISIHNLDQVQAPAYGRNMIRNAPSTVFVEGFRTNILPGTQKGFSGKAIVFAKFEKLIK